MQQALSLVTLAATCAVGPLACTNLGITEASPPVHQGISDESNPIGWKDATPASDLERPPLAMPESAAAGPRELGLFQAPNPWNTPIDQAPTSPSSEAIIQWLDAHGGWGTGAMRTDFLITLLHADDSAPFRSFTPTDDFVMPDCDQVPFPLPAHGTLEGEEGMACTTGGDCHLLVVHEPTHTLYEMWRADLSGSSFLGGCAAVWDLTRSYPPNLRGDGCTSADAGGFPIASMLVTADEVARGFVPHAVRFILPNQRIRGGDVYVRPATHTTQATAGGPDAPPYGARFRLRADYPMDRLPSAGARVVAKAMQQYGMILSDGGVIALTFANDRFTEHTWDEVGIDAQSMQPLQVTDFEVVDPGNLIPIPSTCTRTP